MDVVSLECPKLAGNRNTVLNVSRRIIATLVLSAMEWRL